ncbi:MAG: plastocyanin/azurin family copper-binding protein [Pseudomonadota bacterium]
MLKICRPSITGFTKARLGKLAPLMMSVVAACFASALHAEEHIIEMRNQGDDGTMVFQPAFLKVALGDTVTFEPTQKGGHNTQSTLVPEGAESWKSAYDTAISIEMTVEGVYVYVCQPHIVLGMAGVIQVGEAVNLEAAKAAAAQTSGQFAMNTDRLTNALAKIE